MNGFSLRTKSRRAQTLARLALAAACLAAYVLVTMLLALGNPLAFWGVTQMRVFLPALVLFGILAYETRWDGEIRWRKEVEVEIKGEGEGEEGGVNSRSGRKEYQIHSTPTPSPLPSTPLPPPTPTQNSNFSLSASLPPSPPPSPPPPSLSTSSLSPDEAWAAARAMPHNVVPDPVQERDYYALIVQAANGGHVEALLKLSEYAQKRGANVEAYYWAAVAQKRGAKGLDGRMGEIRKKWLFNQADGEYENVYEFFPETCGTISRSLLRIACSIDAPYARQRLRELASFGDTNAKLFC